MKGMTCRVEITRLSRVALAIDATRLTVTGVVLLLLPDLFSNHNYDIINSIFPITWLCIAFLAVGAYCYYAVAVQGVRKVRHAFQASAILTCIWLATFIASLLAGNESAIRAIIPYASLLAIDFVFIATSVQKKDGAR